MTDRPLYIPGSAGETFGRVLRARRAGRFLFRESRYAPRLRMPPHYHPRPYFTYVSQGGLREQARQADHDYAAGSVHFHPAGDPHAVRTGSDGATCLSIILCGEFDGPVATAPAGASLGAPQAPVARLARGCLRELSASDSASDLALEAFALELLAALLRGRMRAERTVPLWLLAVRDHLHARWADRLRLGDLSAVAGVHEVHLVRAFRRHFGVTPGAYLRELRIERARAALVASDVPIAELALAAGFSDQSHFTRIFHRLVGATPAAYRRTRSRRGS
jgi:AraC family transcriptional regulator